MLKNENLDQFIGTENYYKWSILFSRHVLSDGAKFVADNGGGHGAYWLMDAIASHHPKVRHLSIQFWTLKVNPDGSALLTCREDDGMRPIVSQKIDHTDFDLKEIKFYVQPTQLESGEKLWVIFLPSEY